MSLYNSYFKVGGRRAPAAKWPGRGLLGAFMPVSAGRGVIAARPQYRQVGPSLIARFLFSNSSSVRGQSSRKSRDQARSASRRPFIWQVAQ